MSPKVRNTSTYNMCQTIVAEESQPQCDSMEKVMVMIDTLREEITNLQRLTTIHVDASWLIPEPDGGDEDLDALLEGDDLVMDPEPLSKLPPAPKFPSPREPNFRHSALPMWISTFKLTASTILHRLHGTTAFKKATFQYWMSQVNSDLQHPELHKIIHNTSSSINTKLMEIKNSFGYSKERYEKGIRHRIMNLDIGEHDLVRPLWQRFKTAFREGLRLNLISNGDKIELLDRVREVCAMSVPLQERVGNLLRLRIITSNGTVYLPNDPISFDRMASIVDHAIITLEDERGKPLRRDRSQDTEKSQHRNSTNTPSTTGQHKANGSIHPKSKPYINTRMELRPANSENSHQLNNTFMTKNLPQKRADFTESNTNSTVKVRRIENGHPPSD